MKKFNSNWKLPGLLLLSIFIFNINLFGNNKRSEDSIYKNINVDTAFLLVQENAYNPKFIILDVRTLGEYSIYHLWNGVMLDYNSPSFDSMLNTLDKNKTYLVHCASGGRSNNALIRMKSKEFKYLYNMLGGIGAWNVAGYPTTDSTRPVFMSVSDTFLQFDSMLVGEYDTIEVTVTNFGNSLLNLNSLTGISGSDFVSDFIPGTEISGLYDYTFSIIYKPTDQIPDSILISLQSNGGEQNYLIKGMMKTSSLNEFSKKQICVYPNPSHGVFYVNEKNIQKLELFNLSGKKILEKHLDLIDHNINEIDIRNMDKGCYLLIITSSAYQRRELIILD